MELEIRETRRIETVLEISEPENEEPMEMQSDQHGMVLEVHKNYRTQTMIEMLEPDV